MSIRTKKVYVNFRATRVFLGIKINDPAEQMFLGVSLSETAKLHTDQYLFHATASSF
jgi:hypothetical protein